MTLGPDLQPLCVLQCAFKSGNLSVLLIIPTWENLRETLWVRNTRLPSSLPTTTPDTAAALGYTGLIRIIRIQEQAVRSRRVLRAWLLLGWRPSRPPSRFGNSKPLELTKRRCLLSVPLPHGFLYAARCWSSPVGNAELLVPVFYGGVGVWNLFWSALCEPRQKRSG